MLSVIPIDQSERWDAWVRSFPDYDVCYLNGYAGAFQSHGEGEPLLLAYDDGTTRAMNVVMQRDLSDCSHFRGRLTPGECFDLATPYGYGGFWVDGPAPEKVEEGYLDFLRSAGYITEFVRFHIMGHAHKSFSGRVESRTQNVVRSLDLSWEEILRDFEHKVRKNLKKAERAGLEIEFDFTGDRLPEFLSIYSSTMDRNRASRTYRFSEAFFQHLHRLQGHFVYLYVRHQSKVISTELVLYGAENALSFLGGTDSESFSLRPNDFLKCEAIRWAQEAGLKRYILGGGYGQDDGIFRYKRSFAPSGLKPFYIGKRILDSERHQRLIRLRADVAASPPDPRFFPSYRG